MLILFIAGVTGGALIIGILRPWESSTQLVISLIALAILSASGAYLLFRKMNHFTKSLLAANNREKQLRLLFNVLPERIVVMDYDGRYLDVLQAHYGTRPYIAEDRKGRQLHEVFEKEFADYCLQIIQNCIDTRTPNTTEYERTENGQTYVISVQVVPFDDPETGKTLAIWVSHDITKRKQAERGIRDSENRLRAVVSTLPDRVVLLDAEGRYHDVLRGEYDDNVSLGVFGGFQGEFLHERFDKDFADFCLAKVKEALNNEKIQVFEYTFTQDQNTYSLEGRVIPYRDPLDGESRVIWLSRDITERKQMEQSLIESEKLLRSIVSALPDRTLIFDLDGRYKEILQPALNSSVRPRWLTSVQIGKTIHDMFPREFADFCLENIRKTAETGEMQVFQYPSPMAEAQLFFEARTIPFRDIQSDQMLVLWVSRDISDQKEAEQRQLELALEREKLEFFQQFVDNMTHDLKTPLTVIGTSLYLLERSKDDEVRQQRIGTIHKQLDLLQQMIDDMLVIGRLDTIPQLKLEKLDYLSILEETITQLRPRAEQKGQELNILLPDDSINIPCAGNELRRAIVNLIDNAIKYTPDMGRIDIKVYPDKTTIITEVRDTGIGIQQVDIPHVFDRFFRSANGRSIANGSGLGLAITQRIIELHGGKIEVESEIDKGTIFRVHLPAS